MKLNDYYIKKELWPAGFSLKTLELLKAPSTTFLILNSLRKNVMPKIRIFSLGGICCLNSVYQLKRK